MIATIPERRDQFEKLIRNLSGNEGVEVLFDNRPRHALSIGAKRQALLEKATGRYICFHDDDDWHSVSYASAIVAATKESPDCIGFLIECRGMGRSQLDRKRKGTKLAIASNRYDKWADDFDGYDYVRTIYHKTPVKREHALAVGFRDMRFAEDHDYSMRLKASGLLNVEVFIPEPLYIYRYNYEPHNIKYGIT